MIRRRAHGDRMLDGLSHTCVHEHKTRIWTRKTQVRQVKVLGVLCLIDDGEADWKVGASEMGISTRVRLLKHTYLSID